MRNVWQLQEAKARLSELVRAAERDGPQEISLRGQPAAVVLSPQDYSRLAKPKQRFAQFIRSSPLHGVRLNLERDKSPAREVDL